MAQVYSDDTEQHVAVKKWKYFVLVGIVIAAFLTSAIVLIFARHALSGIEIADTFYPYSFPAAIFLFTYIVVSFQKIETEWYGGITVFEQPALECGPGWWFVPKGFAHLRKAPRDIIRVRISTTEEGEPIRIQTGQPNEDFAADDPLNVQMTLGVTLVARWQIARQRFFDFYVRVPGKTWEEEEENIREQLRDVGLSTIAAQFAEGPVAHVVNKLKVIDKELFDALKDAVEDWGIILRFAALESPDLSHRLNSALADIGTARATAQSTVTNAEAARRSTILAAEAEKERGRLVGEGEAAARIAKAEAIKAERAAEYSWIKKVQDETGLTPEQILAARVAENTLGKGSTFVLGADGFKDAVANIGKAVMDASKGTK